MVSDIRQLDLIFIAILFAINDLNVFEPSYNENRVRRFGICRLCHYTRRSVFREQQLYMNSKTEILFHYQAIGLALGQGMALLLFWPAILYEE